ncbi:MAG TPA: hypothetical protein EYG57_08070 [Planctomycetes bacterium]|nr:hypothetical protein [Verrucomicrobiales bacterium]HIM29499.1 hypothetical protein [Planctomycetota bacterium]
MFRKNRWLFLSLVFAGLNSWQLAQGGLVAHWPLNEGSGEVFQDVVGGFDGFLPNDDLGEKAEISWSDGPPAIQENSVEFLGINSIITTAFPGIGGNNPRTVAFWVRTTDTAAYFLAWGSNTATRKWHIRTNGGSGVLRTEFATGQNFATTSVIDGEWHHVASVFPNGASEGEQILHYVDGVLDEQTGGTSRTIDTEIPTDGDVDWTDANSLNAYSVHFGGVLAHGFGRMLEGSMADVRIYDEGLSEERIRAIFEGEDVGGVVPFEITDIDYSSADDRVTLTWESQAGMLYNLRSSSDLTGNISTWTLVEGDIPGTPDINTKSFARPDDPALFYQLEQFPTPPLTVFSEDFDDGPDLPTGWSKGVNAGDTGTTQWEAGNPAGGPGPATANSGANCIGTNLAANYGISSDIWLRTPGTIDLTTATDATLVFRQWVDMDNFDFGDAGTVRVLDAAGLPGTVTELAVLKTNIQGLFPTAWGKFTKRLPVEALGKTVVLEFRFNSDFVPDADASGWYIDDVVVTVKVP